MPTERRKFGDLGESIAEQYLIKNGYLILERNFRVKLGELDIIAIKTNNKEIGKFPYYNKEIMRKLLLNREIILVFVEVKSGKFNENKVLRETLCNYNEGNINPEEHIDSRKKRLLIRSAQIYLAYKKLPLDINWQIDVIALDIDKDGRKANLRHIKKAVTL